MSSYKIETFVNLEQTTVASDIPNSPNDFTCYNYLKNFKKDWDIDQYTDGQKKMISVMRTGLSTRKSDVTTNNPYTHSCIVPFQHLQTFGISNNCSIQNHKLQYTKQLETPTGCVIDLRSEYDDESKFKSLLNVMEEGYNRDYIDQIRSLEAQIAAMERDIENAKQTEKQLDVEITNLSTTYQDLCEKSIFNIGCDKDNTFKETKKIRDDLNNLIYRRYVWYLFYKQNTPIIISSPIQKDIENLVKKYITYIKFIQ
jgi:hypothetical protein